jgi:hypothetical protein
VRIGLKPLAREDSDPELLALIVLAAGLVAVGGWVALGLGFPDCTLRAWTGIPCLTCGGTRCARALLEGDVWLALKWNPLVVVAAIAAAVFVVYAVVVTGFRWRRVRVWGLSRGERRGLLIGIFAVAGLNWGYLLWRFAG